MTEENHPERGAFAQMKYYPPGHKESVANLQALWNAAGTTARKLSELVSEDTQAAIDNAVLSGVAIALDEPQAVAYLAAARLDHDYRLAVRGKTEIALEYLVRLAEPLVPNPPVDMWGDVRVITAAGVSTSRFPFTRSELEAISEARDARQQLVETGDRQGDATREFSTRSQFFPTIAQRTPFSGGLTYRPSAIWGIMTAARAAEDALTDFAGTAWEPRGVTVGQLIIVRDLPDKLIRHKPTAGK